jgi:hypothetical protein
MYVGLVKRAADKPRSTRTTAPPGHPCRLSEAAPLDLETSLERRPPPVRLAQDGGRDPRDARRLLRADLWLRALGVAVCEHVAVWEGSQADVVTRAAIECVHARVRGRAREGVVAGVALQGVDAGATVEDVIVDSAA